MRLNLEQREAVEAEGHLALSSCPGSGKTRTIVAKLLRCVEEVRGSTRKVGCITYTNAAVGEIEDRLRHLSPSTDEDCYEVGTIHSFCLNNVLRPYYFLIEEIREGFEIVGPDDPWFRETVRALVSEFGLDQHAAEEFQLIQREPDGTLFLPSNITKASAHEFLRQLAANRYVTLKDIVYYSFNLVSSRRYIARGLAARFRWLLIDEFQDTSAAQVEILKHICTYGRTQLFLVGDPNQAIFGFAGARPQLMREFAREIGARVDLHLSGNYRCSARIVSVAERLCTGAPPMVAVGIHRNFREGPVYAHAASAIDGILNQFLPTVQRLGIGFGDVAILAPSWFPLLHLTRRLRDLGLPVTGPGARPYRREHTFSYFVEHLCAYIQKPGGDTAAGAQKALFVMLSNIIGEPPWGVFSFSGKRALCTIVASTRRLLAEHRFAQDWLLPASDECSMILIEQGLLPARKAHALGDSARAMVEDMSRQNSSVPPVTVEQLGMFARPGECIHLLTMHRAKGREFDAVAIVDLHEGRLPHSSAESDEDYAEARRLLYVASTRPRKLLMYLTDSSHWRNRPSRFLGPEGLDLANS